MLIPRTLILSDGSLPSLLACVACREERVAAESAAGESSRGGARGGGGGGGDAPIVLAFPYRLFGDEQRIARIAAQAADLGMEVVTEPPVTIGGLEISDAHREFQELLAAAYLAAGFGCERVVWAATAAVGDAIDLDRLADVTDRALLASRVVAMDRAAKCAAMLIDTPYADFTDAQVAEAALDLDVPVDSLWHTNLAGQDADADRRRWGVALSTAGYRVAGAP